MRGGTSIDFKALSLHHLLPLAPDRSVGLRNGRPNSVSAKIPDLPVKTTDTSSRLDRNTTSADVARVLRTRILEGRYVPEQFLRQDAIAQELGVSRIPVREALHLLESEGLLHHVKYRGAVVPRLSLDELTEIYELRAIIEPYLMRHAINNITPIQLALVRDILTRSCEIPTPTLEWVTLNVEFHKRLYEAANKPLALQSLQNLLVRADRYLKAQRDRTPPMKERSDAEHRRIFERVEARDIEGGIAALMSHIEWNAEDVQHSISFVGQPAVTR
jgi:DNA-binding GntR family transcriptional regulator